MQYFVYLIAMCVCAAIGWLFCNLLVAGPLRCKIYHRESEIMELRKLTAYWQKMFWREINNNTKLRNSVDETCRN